METENHPQKLNETINKPLRQAILKFENVSIVRSPLLKIYFWESFDIESLNNKLSSQARYIEHHLELPVSHLKSNPLKIIFWLRNSSNDEFILRLKRIQNCQCMPIETKVGFNQYRHLYHCPHRRLIYISHDSFVMKPHALLPIAMVFYSFILGTYILSYELRVADGHTIVLHFHINITIFDAVKSVLTTNMIPINIKEHRYMSQAIWIQNITDQNLSLLFSTKNRGFRLINSNMIIPPQSIWPLIVSYRPNDFENKLQLGLKYGDNISIKCSTENRFKIPICCKGFLEEEKENYTVPILDYECKDYPYVIYPNRLEFITELNEERTLMVAVHNRDEKCMQFKWQSYGINEYFSFTFEPTEFSLKPNHSKLCVVHVKTFNNPLHFKRIPAVLEVHSIQDKSTQIAQQLLSEIESIDDPKWAESTYVEHMFLHLDLKVEFNKLQRVNVERASDDESSVANYICGTDNCPTIFEKLFWEYLSRSKHMRNTSKIPRNLTYKQVLNQETNAKNIKPTSMDKKEILKILSSLVAEACRDVAKNFPFVPPETCDPF